MGFMQLEGLADAKEAERLPECRTHLRVDSVHAYVKEDTGRQIIRVIHKVEDDRFKNAANIFHFLAFPKEDDEPSTQQLMLLNIKRYLTMAGVPFEAAGFNEEDLYGAEFDASVILVENEQTGDMVNNIKLDPLPSEIKKKK